MAQLNNLLVTGDTRILNRAHADIDGDSATVNSHTVEKDVPADAVFTDANVTQTATTANNSYEILMSESANNTTKTEGARKTATLLYNPSTQYLKAPKARFGVTIYGVSSGKTSSAFKETLVKTGIKWVSSSMMPVVNLVGWKYDSRVPVDISVGFYIYGDKIGYTGVINRGGWSPDLYLFKYERDSVNYVAIGLDGSGNFLQLQANIQEQMGEFTYVDVGPTKWTWEFLNTTGNIPTPDDGTTCVKATYRANILNPSKVNGHTVNSDVPEDAVFTDTTYTFTSGTNSFTVTPVGGDAQTVTVTPSIANNITGSGTSGYIAKFNGTNTITNGPQLGSSTTTYLRNDGSWETPTDTKNTAGSTDSSSKLFLIGATSQAANPQTYSQDTAYVGTDGHLYSNGSQVLNASQGYTKNTGTITGVSVNGTSVATSGVANITNVPASILSGAIKNGVTATTQSAGDNSTKVATTAYVDTAIDNLPEPMVFRGSLGTGGTITTLPVDGSATVGDTYKVITAGTYASQSAKVGDTFICDSKTSTANTWILIPSGDEPSGTVTSITLKATSPIAIDSTAAITTSGTRTLSHANSGVTAGTYKSVTVNATGHVTAGTNPTTIAGYGITDAKIASGTITLGSNTITPLTSSSTLDATKLSGTIPSTCYTDTKNTAGSTDTSSKIYLVGATSQAANPQTYSDDEVYTTSGTLTTKEVAVGGGSATMRFNSTDNSIEFVFS